MVARKRGLYDGGYEPINETSKINSEADTGPKLQGFEEKPMESLDLESAHAPD